MMRVTSALSALRLAGGVKPVGAGGINVSLGVMRLCGCVFSDGVLPDPIVTEEGAGGCDVDSSAPLGCVDSGRSGEGVAAGFALGLAGAGCGLASVALPVLA